MNLLIIVLSIYVLLALMADTFFKLPAEVSSLITIVDDIICVIFLLDFGLRFYQAENKLRFMKWGWIDLVSSIPFIPIIRAGRIVRLVRLIRILRAFRSVKVLMKHIYKSRIKGTMTVVCIITILLIIFASISILIVETDPASNIKTAGDALWWSFSTITTVGYGDRFPVTVFGRLIGVILMCAGVGLFGTFTAYISTWFIQGREKTTNS
ncbi:MAG: ion transporter [Bacteroidota bacterium]